MHRLLSRFAGLCTLFLLIGAPSRPALADPDLTSLADRVFSLVNQQRAAHGLAPLERVSPLDQSAQDYAVEMAAGDFFAHIAPDGSTPAGRMLATGYSWSAWGENIGAGLDTAEAMMDAWMHSPGHAANILSDGYTQVGIGVAVGGTYGIYWVEDFGTPLTPPPGPWVPRLDRVTAANGQAGDLLTLEGASFGSPGSVAIGGVPAYVEKWTTSSVSVRVPAGATGTVVLTNSYGSSNSLTFGSAPPGPAAPGPTPTPPSTPAMPGSSHSPPPPSSPGPPTSTTPTPPATPTSPGSAAPTPLQPPSPTFVATPASPPSSPASPSPPPSSNTTPSSSPAPAASVTLWRATPPATGLRFDYVTPRRGPSGTTVRLIGAGFGAATGQVEVDGGAATVISWSDTEIDIQIQSAQPGRKGIWVLRADGHASPIRAFHLSP